MVSSTETWLTVPRVELGDILRRACLVKIYPTDFGVGSRYELSGSAITIGRDEDCEVCVRDNSVSRRHARIEPASGGGYLICDLASTNGSFVNDEQVNSSRTIGDGDYLRTGNTIFRFLAGGNVEGAYHEEIYRLTILDGLTQIHNRRYLLEFLDREIARAVRHSRPLSLALLDIDHFKGVNDRLGHLAGDVVLRDLAQLARHLVRREDLLARYGGEEFALVLVEADRTRAKEVADRVRRAVEAHEFRIDDEPFHVTASAGVADCTEPEAGSVDGLIKRADEKLYQAKAAGRNRVVF